MIEVTVLATLLGILGTVCAIVFGYHAFSRNRKKDEEEEGKESGTLLTEIGYIKSGVDDIKRKQAEQDRQHIEVVTRLTAVEVSTKQAHKRLDRMENREGTN